MVSWASSRSNSNWMAARRSIWVTSFSSRAWPRTIKLPARPSPVQVASPVSTTWVVLATVAFFGVFLWFVDLGVQHGVQYIFKKFGV
jgi:hypothetical protein